MALQLKEAQAYVNRCIGVMKGPYRNYAVSDFINYIDWIEPPKATLADLQKTWALYLKWAALCKANHQYGSANGTAFSPQMVKKFWYTPGASAKNEPTLHAQKPNPQGLAKEIELKGVGQCEYFATQAYQALKAQGAAGTTPRVEKVSTPGHNWVLVNRSHGADNTDDWVAVDLWLFAMGVAADKCICAWKFANPQFGPNEIKVVEEFNPDEQV